MSSLSARVRAAENVNISSEDILSDAAEILYPDRYRNIHGDPGSEIIYASDHFGDIWLKTAASNDGDDYFLFAHYLWNAGLQLAELISDGSPAREDAVLESSMPERPVNWSVKGEKVLELGAGTGLVGIMSALAGAEQVTMSDYPSPVILEALKHNLSCNIKQDHPGSVMVEGHEWGTFTDNFSRSKAGAFTRILSADCIWMEGKQEQLLSSFQYFLSPATRARVWVVAGFHTGREVVATFFERASRAGFEAEAIWEKDVNGSERAWSAHLDASEDDIEYRRKWLVIAILKRRNGSTSTEIGETGT